MFPVSLCSLRSSVMGIGSTSTLQNAWMVSAVRHDSSLTTSVIARKISGASILRESDSRRSTERRLKVRLSGMWQVR